jgi:hypothetical protein
LKKITLIFILLFLELLSNQSFAQVGKEFWFAAPDVSNQHGDDPVYLRLTAQGIASTVVISIPANNAFTPITVNLTANQTQTVNLTTFLSSIETSSPNAVQNTGLFISATNNISAYYEVDGGGVNRDIFTLKGGNALGDEFYIPAQSSLFNGTLFYSDVYSMVLIVASEDGTIVNFTPTTNITGNTANQVVTINLNRGQVYYARVLSTLTSLGGSYLSSNKPVAITLADDSNFLTYNVVTYCMDLAGDQLIPTSKIGREYIVLKGFLKTRFLGTDYPQNDFVYVLATQNNTAIYLNGSATPSYTLDAGEQQYISMSTSSLYITASEDVYVLHMTGFGCEVGMAVVPSIYCTGTESVTITRSSSEDFYMLLLVPTGSEDDFTTDGNNSIIKTNDFVAVPGTGGQWMMCRLLVGTNKLGSGTSTQVENATSLFHLGIINGGASTGTLYGYFSDFSQVITGAIYHF